MSLVVSLTCAGESDRFEARIILRCMQSGQLLMQSSAASDSNLTINHAFNRAGHSHLHIHLASVHAVISWTRTMH